MKMNQVAMLILMAALSASAFAQQLAWSEFMAGERDSYSTKGVEKGQNLEVSFDYPASWSGADGRRPNTLYQVTSDKGKGLEFCNLVIRELALPSDHTPTRAEAEELFEPEILTNYVPAGASFIDGAPTQLDGQPGAWIHFSQDMNRAGTSIRMQWVAFPIYYDGKLITFSCGVAASGATPANIVQDRYSNFLPLFQQMASSLIVHSRWKSAPK